MKRIENVIEIEKEKRNEKRIGNVKGKEIEIDRELIKGQEADLILIAAGGWNVRENGKGRKEMIQRGNMTETEGTHKTGSQAS